MKESLRGRWRDKSAKHRPHPHLYFVSACSTQRYETFRSAPLEVANVYWKFFARTLRRTRRYQEKKKKGEMAECESAIPAM